MHKGLSYVLVAILTACSGAVTDSDQPLPETTTTTQAPPSTKPSTTTSIPVAPPGETDESALEQTTEPVPDDGGFEVIAQFVEAWRAQDVAAMGELSASDLPDSVLDWLIALGTPAGEPYECSQWEDDDGPVAQCSVEVPDHGEYEEETHYVLARPNAGGTWEVTWAAVMTA